MPELTSEQKSLLHEILGEEVNVCREMINDGEDVEFHEERLEQVLILLDILI